MSHIRSENDNEPLVLAEAFINTIEAFGISYDETSQIISQQYQQILDKGIDPESESGKAAITLINCYRLIYGLVGGNKKHIKHWIHTYNKGLKDIPANLIATQKGLDSVLEYLSQIISEPYL